jgi:carboxymethylenebutenolidase
VEQDMIEKQVDVRTPDGVADCELFYPGEQGSWPGVIVYTDIGGLRPVFRDMGKRLAGDGFVVLMPNPFYRVSRVPVYHDPFKFGEEKTAARMADLRPSVTAAGAMRDAPAFVDFLLSQKQVKGKVGTVGYCMGGGLAMRTAAALPQTVAACVSFHGSQLVSAEPDSPHTLAPKIKAQMYLGFAIEDRTMPPEAVEKLKAALDAAGVRYDSETYAGARHGWCVKDHTVYNEPQAERAWANMISLFRRALN